MGYDSAHASGEHEKTIYCAVAIRPRAMAVISTYASRGSVASQPVDSAARLRRYRMVLGCTLSSLAQVSSDPPYFRNVETVSNVGSSGPAAVRLPYTTRISSSRASSSPISARSGSASSVRSGRGRDCAVAAKAGAASDSTAWPERIAWRLRRRYVAVPRR